MTAAAHGLPATIALEELGPTRYLARGGVGQVDALTTLDGPPLVLKRFHDPGQVDGAILRRLVAWRRALSSGEQRRLDDVTAWPLSVVTVDDALIGFVMHRVPEAMTDVVRLPSGTQRHVLREAQYLLAGRDHARHLRVPAISSRGRLELVWALAEAIAFLHRLRIVIGDLSTRNVLWRPDPGRILLVDCDSFTFGGLGSPLPSTFTVDWDDPAQPGAHAASADIYKLGLFALRVLSRSFQTRDPAAVPGVLDATGRLLLRGSLSPDPAARPNAQAWERWATGRRAASTTRSKEHLRHV